MADIFERLSAGRPQQTKKPTKRQLEPETILAGSTDLVSRWAQKADIKTFLTNILASGPVPTTVIIERGAARGFNKRQLERTRKQMGAIAFKEQKFQGRWFWTPTQLTPEQVTAVKHNDRYTRRLRNISRTLGYRLQPMVGYPRPPENEENEQK